jgi:hypothetical protein
LLLQLITGGCRGFNTETWFEAEANCRTQGGKLPFKPSGGANGSFEWVAYHQRLSSWIKILGEFFFYFS